MTERIKELKREAEALAYEEHKANCIKNGRDTSMPHANALNMTFEKFAELIVRECALTLYKNAVQDKQAGFAHEAKIMELAGDIVKQHFGVQ